MFIKYCVFSKDFRIFRTLFSLDVSVCTHTRQAKHQRCSRTGRVKKNHNILRKKHNIWWTPCSSKRSSWKQTLDVTSPDFVLRCGLVDLEKEVVVYIVRLVEFCLKKTMKWKSKKFLISSPADVLSLIWSLLL